MKSFLKYTLATIVGILVTWFLGMFVFFAFVGAIASSSSSTTVLKSNSVYQLDLSGVLIDRSSDDPFAGLVGELTGSSTATIGLDDVLKNIEKAKNDANIVGIYLKDGSLSAGYAQVKEIRDALIDFKTSGKFIVAYADSYTQRMYYLASVADKVLLNPKGMVDFKGIGSQVMFLKNTLDKLGIEMQVVKVGTFKSAVEPYIQTKMSDANREQVTKYVSSIWGNLLNEVSESRSISTDKLNAYADEMMMLQPSEKVLEYGMVDALVYSDEVEDIIKELIGGEELTPAYVKHTAMNTVPANKKLHKEKLAVIYAVGSIDDGSREGIVSNDLVETINKVAKDESVKAVVFRVNSPGGSAYGSEQIWHSLMKLKEKKPLIVSMSDYAASGGYYISCMADSILAEPNTLTGSIGIFGVIPNLRGLFDKVGLSYDGVKTNKMTDALSSNRGFTPEERNLMQKYVNEGYELFVKRCADGRGMTVEQIKAVAEGRVWTGEDAIELGLVDAIGGLSDAVRIAAEKAELENYRISEYPEKEDFTAKLLKNFSGEIEAKFVKARLGESYQLFEQINNIDKMDNLQARLPYNLIVE